MALRYVTPRELIEALHERGSGARAELHALLQASFARLIEDLRSHYELKHASATLTRNALHAAEQAGASARTVLLMWGYRRPSDPAPAASPPPERK